MGEAVVAGSASRHLLLSSYIIMVLSRMSLLEAPHGMRIDKLLDLLQLLAFEF